MNLFEEIPALSPVQFFGIFCDFPYIKGEIRASRDFLLPSTSELLAEESFADVYGGWNVDKLSFLAEVRVPFEKVGEADFRKGDSLELFIDTRDLKMKGTVSRFCHHFVFFPAAVQGHFGREITRMRGEDVHRICDPEDLIVEADCGSSSYTLAVEIPAHCLFGFEPLSHPRIGFTYRINRAAGPPQHFSVSSEEYAIEQHPATWGTLQLSREDR